jgi:hypothetical protein
MGPMSKCRDPAYVDRWIPVMKTVVKRWFRSEVNDLAELPRRRCPCGVQSLGRHDRDGRAVFATDLFDTFGSNDRVNSTDHVSYLLPRRSARTPEKK